MINRDPRNLDITTSQYCIGFEYDENNKYFHVKLGPKSLICGYEHLFNKNAEYTYKSLMHLDGYGLRKK